MIASLAIGLAVLFAVAALGHRRWRERRQEAQRAGASLRLAIPVRRFDQIERVLGRRVCRCGERLVPQGEDSRQIEGRRFRVVQMLCPECERLERVYFDVTQAFH
jgi:hypothetical protein